MKVVMDWIEWGFLVMLLVTLTWPLWRSGVTNINNGVEIIDVLCVLPSLATAMGFSWEIAHLPFSSLLALKLCEGMFCFASLLSRRANSYELWIFPAVIMVTSTLSIFSPRKISKLYLKNEEVDIPFEIVKLLLGLMSIAVAAVVIAFVRSEDFWDELLTQIPMVAGVMLICTLSILWPGEVSLYGLGTPLIGLFVRIGLTPGARSFFVYWAFSALWFVMINWGSSNQSAWNLLKGHWCRWQESKNSNGILLFCIALAIGALAVNAPIGDLTVNAQETYFSSLCTNDAAKLLTLEEANFNAKTSWAYLSIERIRDFFSKQQDYYCSRSTLTESISVGSSSVFYSCLLVLVSSCALVCLQGIYDKVERRSVWLPISFFSLGAVFTFGQGSDMVEIRRHFDDSMITYTESFKMSMALCVLGGISSAALLMIKIGKKPSGSLIMLRSDESCSKNIRVKERQICRETLTLPLLVAMFCCAISFASPFIHEGNLNLKARFCDIAQQYPIWAVESHLNDTNSEIEETILKAFVPELTFNETFVRGTNYSRAELFTILARLDLLERDRRFRGFDDISQKGLWYSIDDFGPKIFSRSTTLVIGGIDVAALLCIVCALWFPFFDDLALGFLGCVAVIMSISFPDDIAFVRRITLAGCHTEYPFSWTLIVQVCAHIALMMLLIRERMIIITREPCLLERDREAMSLSALNEEFLRRDDICNVKEFAEALGYDDFRGNTILELFAVSSGRRNPLNSS